MSRPTFLMTLCFLVAGEAPSWAQSTPEPVEPAAAARYVWQAVAPEAGGFSVEQAVASAQQAAPSLGAADADVEATVARNRQTLSRYVPRLGARASYLRKNPLTFDFSGGAASVGAANQGTLGVGACPPGTPGSCVVDSSGVPVNALVPPPLAIPVDNYSLQLDLSVPFSDYVLALNPAVRAARADETAARLRRAAEADNVAVNARIAYYDWARARAQVALAQRSVASAQARQADARLGLAAGTITKADALGIENLVTTSRVALAQAESFLRLAGQNLLVTTQWKGALVPGEDLSLPTPAVHTLGRLEDLIKKAQEERLEMRALRTSAAAAHHAETGALSGLFPRVDGVANVTHANPNQAFFPPSPVWNTSWYVGVNVSWQLDLFLNARAQRRELDATTKTLLAQHEAMARAIEMEVRSAWEEWQRAEASTELAASEIAATLAMYEQRTALFRGGEATSTDVTEAEVQRQNAALRLVNAAIDKRIALARLRRAAALDARQE
ncbi:MAG: TolC family protein [Myxococcales bacterium]|nr:TolC family protein [Myxococcales bacterium]